MMSLARREPELYTRVWHLRLHCMPASLAVLHISNHVYAFLQTAKAINSYCFWYVDAHQAWPHFFLHFSLNVWQVSCCMHLTKAESRRIHASTSNPAYTVRYRLQGSRKGEFTARTGLIMCYLAFFCLV
jgi:hypothetical protein